MKPLEHLMLPHAEVEVVPAADICSDRCLFMTVDAETVTDEQLDFEASFVLVRGVIHVCVGEACQRLYEYS